MAAEIRLQELCADRLQAYLKQRGYDNIKTGEQTQIIKDCTIVPENGEFTLVMGHAEVDVALYKTDEELTEHIEEDSTFKLYQNADNRFRVPLIVLEIKSGDTTTDMIRNRSIIAREMNEVFPFMGYFFIADNAAPTSLMTWRAGKYLDGFFFSEEEATEEWIDDRLIDDGVRPHLEKLEQLNIV